MSSCCCARETDVDRNVAPGDARLAFQCTRCAYVGPFRPFRMRRVAPGWIMHVQTIAFSNLESGYLNDADQDLAIQSFSG